MRRILCGVLIVLVLTSCAASVASPVTQGFRCHVNIIYEDMSFGGTLDRTDPQSAVLTMTEPEAINGLSMVWNGRELAFSYAGMALTLSEEQLPVGAVARVLCEILDECVQASPPSNVIEGNGVCGEYVMTFDSESGMPLSLQVPSLSLEVTFSAWELPQA